MKFKFKHIIAVASLVLFSQTLSAEGFTLKSDAMIGQMSSAQVFNGFGCIGKNISPELSWENAPKETKSFALTVYDPDAPTGSGWWHWVVFNIPKGTKKISTNASVLKLLPTGSVQSKTDFGTSSFGGACPPKGDKAHSYITTVHALDVDKLDLDENANPALVGYMINMHTIGKSSVMAYYKR
ncbi:MAG: Raf kinase inhibitor-like YbhB/YbcL family protein [Sulfurimonas sp.]|jgi:Raf kinase inhibitor-like YbhB/YbcL family protein|uniref:YbhB/YbcL family Raf kinase inhibitor-like protein n=1 Tax=Sulfurimonas sp. TaxID=2022749 RepID=UPI0039E6E3A9